MILNKNETSICYRCPTCGCQVLSAVGMFEFTKKMLRIKCNCGASYMTITYTNDRKIRLTVPCVFCQNPHNYIIASHLFFGSEMMMFNCSMNSMDICFIGTMANVLKAAELADKYLEEILLANDELDDFDSKTHKELRGEKTSVFREMPPEAQLLGNKIIGHSPTLFDICNYMLNEFAAEGDIICRCHRSLRSGEDENLSPKPEEAKKCGGSFIFEFIQDETPGEEREFESEVLVKFSCTQCGCSVIYSINDIVSPDGTFLIDALYLV